MQIKRVIAAFAAAAAALALAGCMAASGSSKAETAKKDYTEIIRAARSDEDNEAYMIFSNSGEGYTAKYGISGEYEAAQLSDEIKNMLLPMLNLEDDMYTELAASVSAMMVRSYGVAIVKPAEGKTEEVEKALEEYISGQQQAMQNYLEDQYKTAKAAKVETVPTGEVVLVCCENSDAVLKSIKDALAA